jgi:hypothetical protein
LTPTDGTSMIPLSDVPAFGETTQQWSQGLSWFMLENTAEGIKLTYQSFRREGWEGVMRWVDENGITIGNDAVTGISRAGVAVMVFIGQAAQNARWFRVFGRPHAGN